MPEAGEAWAYRLTNIDNRLERIEKLEPAVVRQQVEDIREDVKDIREDIAAVKRIMIGFLVTFAFAGVSTTVAIVMLVGTA